MIQELWAIKSDLIWAGKIVFCAWHFIIKCLIDFLYMYCWYPCCSICTEQTKENKGICKCQRHQPRSVFLIFFIRAVWIWCWYVLDLLNLMICFFFNIQSYFWGSLSCFQGWLIWQCQGTVSTCIDTKHLLCIAYCFLIALKEFI